MKKFILFLFAALLTCSMYAQNYNSAQENMRNQIVNYLAKQGYTAEKQDDGLKFKNEGTNYYIEISKEDVSPMYLRLCRYVKYSDSLKQETVIKQLKSYNTKLGVKVCCTDNGIVISTEMFVASSTDFTDIFPILLSQIKATYKTINE
ncbi:hypothetical protein [Xylanibacter muris]|nr:hypothetical protein [Xylanibacter muris]